MLKTSICNCEVDETRAALVMLCVPWGSVPSPKIQGFPDTQVCIVLDQSCGLQSNQVIHYKLRVIKMSCSPQFVRGCMPKLSVLCKKF